MSIRYTGAIVTLGSILAFATSASAQQPNCSNPMSQAEMTMCAGQDYQRADAALNAAYKKAIASMKDTDAHLPKELKGAEKALRQAQRAWIKFRDNACEAEGFMARGGTMEPMLRAHCAADLTKQRTRQLESLAKGLGG